METTAGLSDFNIEKIAIDPANPTTLYVAAGSGVFRSANGGKNWSELNKGLGEGFVLDLAIASTDPATVYAGTFGGGLFAIQPVGPVPPPVLRITGAFVYRGKLYVFGDKFEEGAKILLNGEKEKTRNAFYNPTATLIGKRAGNKIVRGQTVTLQVRTRTVHYRRNSHLLGRVKGGAERLIVRVSPSGGNRSSGAGFELLLFGRAFERGRRQGPARNGLRYRVKITRADEALVFDGAVSVALALELVFLQMSVSQHPVLPVPARQLVHAEIQRVKSGQRHELEPVSHRPELPLEPCYGRVVELLSPVE